MIEAVCALAWTEELNFGQMDIWKKSIFTPRKYVQLLMSTMYFVAKKKKEKEI